MPTCGVHDLIIRVASSVADGQSAVRRQPCGDGAELRGSAADVPRGLRAICADLITFLNLFLRAHPEFKVGQNVAPNAAYTVKGNTRTHRETRRGLSCILQCLHNSLWAVEGLIKS